MMMKMKMLRSPLAKRWSRPQQEQQYVGLMPPLDNLTLPFRCLRDRRGNQVHLVPPGPLALQDKHQVREETPDQEVLQAHRDLQALLGFLGKTASLG